MATTADWWTNNQPQASLGGGYNGGPGMMATGDPQMGGGYNGGGGVQAAGGPQIGGGYNGGGGLSASFAQPQGGDVNATIQQGIKSAYGREATQQDLDYWSGKWDELNQRGTELNDPSYAWNRLIGKDATGADAAKFGQFAGGAPGGVGAMPGQQFQGMTAGERSTYGVPDTPYGSKAFTGNFDRPALTGGLENPFTMPTQAELEASPGYASRLAAGQRSLQAGAAAKGSILNGGAQKELSRFGQDYASNEYNNLFGQSLATRGQNQNEWQQNVLQPSQYGQTNRYKQYLDENSRTLNDYLTNYNIGRQGVQDFLGQQNRTADRGLSALTAGRPNTGSY